MALHWSDLPLNPNRRMLRQFAALWILFFGAIATYTWLVRGNATAAAAFAAVAGTAGPIGLAAPAAIRPLFVAWLVIGFPIGWAVTRLLIVVLFFGIVCPVGLLFRLRGRDALRLARASERDSYWLPRPPQRDADSYFRQY